MIFGKKKQRETQAVVIQTSLDKDGKPGRFVQRGVVQILQGGGWITGRDETSRDVFQMPSADVAVAFIEELPNG